MAVLTPITGDADGTLNTTDLSHDAGTGTPWWSHMSDNPDGGSSDYVQNNGGLSDGTYVSWLSLENVDADFGSLTQADIDVDVFATGFSNDQCTLTARVADGNGSVTWLTDESSILGENTDTTRAQYNIELAGMTGTKAQWDTAHIRFSWVYNRVGGADGSANLRIYGFLINGTYTVAGAGGPRAVALTGPLAMPFRGPFG